MGVYPYITASIVMQLMVPIVPTLQALSREGEQGRRQIQIYTHWLTVPMALVQGYGQLIIIQSLGGISGIELAGPNALPTLAAVISMTACFMSASARTRSTSSPRCMNSSTRMKRRPRLPAG